MQEKGPARAKSRRRPCYMIRGARFPVLRSYDPAALAPRDAFARARRIPARPRRRRAAVRRSRGPGGAPSQDGAVSGGLQRTLPQADGSRHVHVRRGTRQPTRQVIPTPLVEVLAPRYLTRGTVVRWEGAEPGEWEEKRCRVRQVSQGDSHIRVELPRTKLLHNGSTTMVVALRR